MQRRIINLSASYLSAYRSVLREWSQQLIPGDIMAIYTHKHNVMYSRVEIWSNP